MALLVEMGFGGAVATPATIAWTDVTAYVETGQQGVTITRGAADELAETQPGTATLTLDNADGRFTPGNPGSPYAPHVRRNTPIRIAVAHIPARTGPGPWPLAQLADDFDDGVLDPVLWPNSYGGTVEAGGRVRVPVVPGAYAACQSARTWTLAGSGFTVKVPALPGAGGSSAASISIMVNSVTAGTRAGFTYNPLADTLRLVAETGYWDAAGLTLAHDPLAHAWLRLREESGLLYWETSGDGWTWTVRRTLAAPAWAATDTVAVEMVATRTGGAADAAEFDLAGAIVRPRFWGMVNEFPATWAGLLSTVSVSCTDLFKRLNRMPELRSVLVEEILTYSNPDIALAAYYPLTEPGESTSAGDLAGTGCPPLTVGQSLTGGTAEFGSEGVPALGDGSVTLAPASASAGKYLAANLGAPFEADNLTDWLTVDVWINTTQPGRAILGMYSPTVDHQLVLALNASGVLTVESTDIGGSLFVATTASGVLTDGAWHHIVYDAFSDRVWVDGTLRGTGRLGSYYVAGLRTLHVGAHRGARLFAGQIAHLSLWHSYLGAASLAALHYAAATNAFAGEAADARIQRLAHYAGLSAVTVWGTTHDPVAGQGAAGGTVVSRMREVETTESARLFAERDWYGLAYQSRDVRYNPSPDQETFTIAYADLETGDFQLADDDQKLVNSVFASRPGGATQRVVDTASLTAHGPYEQQLDLLKTSDTAVLSAAQWLVSRYADPPPELREVPVEAYTLPYYLDILDADIGSYFSVTGLPPQAPAATMRVTVEGYTETIKHHSHVVRFLTSASLTDSVWVLGDAVYSVLDVSTRLAY